MKYGIAVPVMPFSRLIVRWMPADFSCTLQNGEVQRRRVNPRLGSYPCRRRWPVTARAKFLIDLMPALKPGQCSLGWRRCNVAPGPWDLFGQAAGVGRLRPGLVADFQSPSAPMALGFHSDIGLLEPPALDVLGQGYDLFLSKPACERRHDGTGPGGPGIGEMGNVPVVGCWPPAWERSTPVAGTRKIGLSDK
ncbi:MAG: hypothetical protein U5R30_10310 [Deltaproteobacteria bacterium]|nr:hypothetical protein [Deltaproteobacteria bacterium]